MKQNGRREVGKKTTHKEERGGWEDKGGGKTKGKKGGGAERADAR